MSTDNTPPSFNTFALHTGITQLDQAGGGNSSFGSAGMLRQPDGLLVLAGTRLSSSGDQDFSVARFHADGSLDTSLGSDGRTLIDTGCIHSADVTASVLMQPDGRLVLVGWSGSNRGDGDFSAMRLLANGSPDPSFGTGGKVTLDASGIQQADSARCVLIQPDGKLVLAGVCGNSSGFSDFVVVRLNADGSPDSSFGTHGRVQMDAGGIGSFNVADSIVIQADGKLVVAGSGFTAQADRNFHVLRLNTDGSLDTGFGSDGKLSFGIADAPEEGDRNDTAHLAVQADGKLVLAGSCLSAADGQGYLGVARLNTDGSLDTSFSGDGKALIDAGGMHGLNSGANLVIQADGKLVLTGASVNSLNDHDLSVVRLNADGSLDTGFSGDGRTLIDAGGIHQYDAAISAVVLPDGKLLLSGNSSDISVGNSTTSLVRLNPDGSLDTTFGDVVPSGTSGASTLDNTATFVAGKAPVILDSQVQIADTELNAAGNYGGASITLTRHGASHADDVFSGSRALSLADGLVTLSGVVVGTVSQAGGTLTIRFDSHATHARVNEVLSSLAYANTSATPPASVQIDWSFSDGNLGSQGTGGALSAVGQTTVLITTASHDLPGATNGPDTLTGTTGTDTLAGLQGNDSLDGGAGVDTASYDGATTPVSAILYNHQASGLSSGNDTLTGIENILGSAWADLVYGDAADNLLDGGAGGDTLDGAEGNDTLLGQTGDDLLNGLAGNDSLDGGDGADSLYGWADDDALTGGTGTDHLFGGTGADSLDGGADADQLEGDDGNDTIAGGTGNDTLRGWNDADSLDGSDGDDALFGGAGADVMLGGAGNDQLEGDDGNDTLGGSSGNDTLRGWNDDDQLSGDDGNDLVVGWSGNDALLGGQGNDSLFGDDGADTLSGGAGADVLQGGLGNDVYSFAIGFGFDGVLDYDYTAGNSDTFQFIGVNRADLSFSRAGDALKVERTTSAGADVITINDWYQAGSNGAYKIETWVMGDGATFTAAQIEALAV